MRTHLNGQEGPIPTEALPDGTIDLNLQPITFRPVNASIFVPETHMTQGYTHYEVRCVGAAGGNGSLMYQYMGGSGYGDYLFSYGGGGGGGGMHKMAGALADLPPEVLITIGEAGANGENRYSPAYGESLNNPPGEGDPDARPGMDGGYSAFGDICMASGGKGGEATPVGYRYHSYGEGFGHTWRGYVIDENDKDISTVRRPGGSGGDGGVGGQTEAGGGGEGGKVSYTRPNNVTIWTTPEGEEGEWIDDIGEGGGGGPGGTYVYGRSAPPQIIYP